jgi:hypothetical protein
LGFADEDIGRCPCVVIGTAVPVVWNILMIVGKDEIIIVVSDIGRERFEDSGCQEASRIFDRVVSQKLRCEHVSAECEGYARIGLREIVRVCGNGVLLSIMLILGHYLGSDVASSSGFGEIKKLLREFGVGSAVGFHV